MNRFFSFVISLLLIFTCSRSIIRSLPGDPLEHLLEESGTQIDAEVLRRELGLDRPFFPALWEDARKMVRGDWGTSLISQKPILPELFFRFHQTAILVLCTLLIGFCISMPVGLLAAIKPGGGMDRACTTWGSLTAALPLPWTGPLLIYLLAVTIPLFGISGEPWLAAIGLSIGFSGFWSRLIRNRVRHTLNFKNASGAATAAMARGISPLLLVLKYGFIPSAGALAAFFGTQLGALLAGSFIAEIIFNRPGMGELFVHAVLARDYPMVEAAVFLSAAISLTGNALGDWTQKWLDPRIS